MKILLISTGGTISCVRDDDIHLENPFKILDFADKNLLQGIDFTCVSPYFILSENLNLNHIKLLIECINNSGNGYDGIIILHGSDTLAYTGAIIANRFYGKNIVLTASDKPLDEKYANGIDNFNCAIEHIKLKKAGVVTSYNGIYDSQTVTSADGLDNFLQIGKPMPPIKEPKLKDSNILVIKPYIGIEYSNYDLSRVDAVLHEMYHSATVPEQAIEFANLCKQKGINFHFVTAKSSADYQSSSSIKDMIIYNSTIENAYARLLLK